jgi:hypothetical protein
MYLALERPWRSAGVAPQAMPDAGVGGEPAVATKAKKKRRPRRSGAGAAPIDREEAATLTAADLRMIWNGDAVARPPASVDMSADGEARSLDGGEIQAALDGGGEALTTCVARGVGAASWSGDVTVKLLVDGDGRVTKTRVHAPAFTFEHGLLACMRQGAARLRFPAVGGWTVVTVPFPVTVE